MSETKEFEFDQLSVCDLLIDAVYKGGGGSSIASEPISKLIPGVGNMGGFRISGSYQDCQYAVLFSTEDNLDWPDHLDLYTGQFTYFGDNRSPGHELHDTPKNGNLLLRAAFNSLHSGNRKKVSPFFVFTKRGTGRDVVFRGLAVPGSPNISANDDLVAIWKSKADQRFQNYRALFTILDCSIISRDWLKELRSSSKPYVHAPESWKNWVQGGAYKPLLSERTIEYRTKSEQLPSTKEHRLIIERIKSYFEGEPTKFEACAAEIFRMSTKNQMHFELTRPWRDGGRDAIGNFRIGLPSNSINVEFALEAKCYSLENSVGIRETSRLISRLRHRQFGVLVTTSYVHSQAYKEIKEDRHPVIIFSAIDICRALQNIGLSDEGKVGDWLSKHF